MRYFFSADYHLGHEGIIKYATRPFKSLSLMDRAIINNHNSRIKDDDVIFFLGDFCFKGETRAKDYQAKLNGSFIFVRGNHDNNNSLRAIIEYALIHHGGHSIFLCHNPQDYNPEYKLNFVAHIHKLWKFKYIKKSKTILVNVGCDVWKYRPIEINEILQDLATWKKENKIK